ncbi:hypothetical protein [Synoicihabitans lomoniglobus]|uniref:Secreted protein n=1 Tax=Synoicihabitans lomoniglobus TaxID=2909285 RepID=A0AAF0CS56_9BACT|nr:hypothetical protein [Opitutaceae bacterium LMO-M01]WED66996.1 hypothetical protein PXH66_09050 [Opitutaceae bacterium LMO-M01]
MTSHRFGTCFILAAFSTLAAIANPIPVVDSQPAPARDHELFVGVDLFLIHDDEMVNVRKIENDKALLDNATREEVRLRDSSGLQWRMGTKVSATSATIEALKSKRVNSPFTNPALKQMRSKQALLDYVDHEKEARDAALVISMRDVESPDASVAFATKVESSTNPFAEGMIADAVAGIDQMTATGKVFDRLTDSPGENDNFDAVELTFNLSSPTPIAEAYVVFIVRVTRDGEIYDTSFYRPVGRIDSTPRKIRFMRAGFPPGFEIQDTRVHLFWQGEEIPTNLSEKHYQVTAEEAKTYL